MLKNNDWLICVVVIVVTGVALVMGDIIFRNRKNVINSILVK